MPQTGIEENRKTLTKEEARRIAKDLAPKICETLSKRRWIHTLGVAHTAAALAMRYDVDLMERAFLAGLLHDAAKEICQDETLRRCEEAGEEVSAMERAYPVLLHAKLGAIVAEEEYAVSDPDILSAIRSHTTGRPGMSLMEEILFIADYMEPGRDRQTDLDAIRSAAFSDRAHAICLITEETLSFLERTGRTIDPMTKETHDYYASLYQERKTDRNE